MNFLFLKASCKKYLLLFLAFFGLIVGFSGCVAIEDLLKPTIGDFSLREQYNVTDTIFLDVVLLDNFGINTVTISIEPINNPASNFRFTEVIRDSVRARLLKLEGYQVVIIPVNATIGEYKFTLTVTDGVANDSEQPNESSIEKTFRIGGDASTPTFTDIELDLELDLDASIIVIDSLTNNYQACRSSIIPIIGTASDNVALNKISFQFTGFPSTFKEFDLNGESLVELSSLFSGLNAIKIPSTVPNGTTIELVFRVTDQVGNEGRASLFFFINCDDQSPLISNIITNLDENINDQEMIEIIQGQELFIIGGEIRDRLGEIKDVSIYFNGSVTPLKTWWIGEEFVNLVSLDSIPLLIPIPSTAIVGRIYQIEIKATDFANNTPATYIIRIEIKDNEDPSINITGTEVNGVRTTFSSNSNSPLAIPAGGAVRIFGKILEDVDLENYRITWGIEGNEQVVVEENNPPNDIVLEVVTNSLLRVGENVRIGTRYVLTIYARDTFNQEIQVRYYFVVR